MAEMLMHRGTGTYFTKDDAWIIDSKYIDEHTGEIRDDDLVTYGKPISHIIPDNDY
jgi:hypothetical protein